MVPVFSNLMRAVRDMYPSLERNQQTLIDARLVELPDEHPQILKVTVNLAFYCQALAASERASTFKEQFLQEILDEASNPICRRIAIGAFAKWKRHHALRALKDSFAAMNPWERRCFLVASYVLGDEGSHWRRLHGQALHSTEAFISDWASDRTQRNQPIPW